MWYHSCLLLWRIWSVEDAVATAAECGGGGGGKGDGCRGVGGGGSGSGGGADGGRGEGAGRGGSGGGNGGAGSTARARVSYDAHLPTLSFWDGENLRTVLEGMVPPTVQGTVLFKNWHLCGMCWEDCERKKMHVPTPPPHMWRQPLLGCRRQPRGNASRTCSLAAAGQLPL